MPGGWRVPLGVGLVSVAVIAFQLVIMQVLSIAHWHHFAYLVISMALLGFGAAGTVLVLVRDTLTRHYQAALPLLLLGCAVTMAGAVWLSGLVGEFDVFLLFLERRQTGMLLFSYLVYCLPFFLAGLAITLVFCVETQRIGALYCANMLGSGCGAALVIALLWLVPVENLPALLACLPLLAAWLTGAGRGRFYGALPVAATVVAASLLLPATPSPSQYKPLSGTLQLPDAEVIHRSHSPYGRLEVVRAPAQRFAPSLSLRYQGEPPVADIMFVNGEYFGTLPWQGTPNGEHVLDYSTRALPYRVRSPSRVLVLDAATGVDAGHALHHDARSVTATEANRQALALLTSNAPEWNQGLHLQPRVQLYNNTARAFLASADRGRDGTRYDAIVLPPIGAFGGTAGVDALQEKFHLTGEALQAMWQLLGEQGMIVATVWLEQPPRASLRLLASARQLLDDAGIREPLDHLLAVRSWGTLTLLISKSPFSEQERTAARDFSAALGFDPLIMAGLQNGERTRYNLSDDHQFFTHVDLITSGDPQPLYRSYPFDIRPVSDDRPYFSRFLQWQTLAEVADRHGVEALPYMELGTVLGVLSLLQVSAIAVVLVLLPLFRVGWRGARRRWTFLYFAGTGIGFLFFEIVLIQQLVLYLGNPVYSTALVLATLLIASALGSLASGRLPAGQRQVMAVGLGVAALIALCALLLSDLVAATMGLPVAVKLLIASAVLALPAFFMGMLFPLGLRRLAAGDGSHIPWACGIDSCLSVTATALATLVAVDAGFTTVIIMAAAAYVLVAVAGCQLGHGAPSSGY